MAISTDDHVAISDLLGRYCWLVDAGDEDAWAALWEEDAVFTGISPEPLVGRDALKQVPRDVKAMSDGKMRHLIGNLHCDYADASRNEVVARYYNFVTMWVQGGAPVCLAKSSLLLVRTGEGWLIRRHDTASLS